MDIAQKLAAAAVSLGNVVEASVKTAQAVKGEVLSGQALQDLTTQSFNAAAKVLQKDARRVVIGRFGGGGDQLTLASVLDSSFNLDAKLASVQPGGLTAGNLAAIEVGMTPTKR